MILNISGRTDILAFYSKWFINRYEEGFVDVRNPIYPKLISRIYFKDVDLIVFCTKNPHHIISYLPKIKEPIIFHVTITPYKKEIEPNVIAKNIIIEDIKKIANIIGPDNIYIRYDPIFLSDTYTLEYHLKAFTKLCSLLHNYTKHIIISFLDIYQNVKKNSHILKIKKITKEDIEIIGKKFSEIANNYQMSIQTCSEYENLSKYGFKIASCISKELVKEKINKSFPKWTSRNNKYCECVQMVDIGSYNSCPHLCKYCYANYNEEEISKNYAKHKYNSSLLIGELDVNDEIKIRTK